MAVGSGTGAVIRRQLLGRSPSFPLRARVGVAVIPFPVPAALHAACGFAALRAPAPLRVKGYGGPSRWTGCSATLVDDSVVIEQSEVAIQPRFAPPLPPETATLACPRQVAPNLLLHPASDARKAATRVAERKVLHPAAEDGIDTRNHRCHGSGLMTSKDLPERLQQRLKRLCRR